MKKIKSDRFRPAEMDMQDDKEKRHRRKLPKWKKDQQATRKKLKQLRRGTLTPGYKFNPFPNRRYRRATAKRAGIYKEPGLWQRANQHPPNVQTHRHQNK